jgi:hypothetical protein
MILLTDSSFRYRWGDGLTISLFFIFEYFL